MKRLKVVDFIFESLGSGKDEFCFSLTVYYTFDSNKVEELEIDDLTYFNITVGTPKGVGAFFEKIRKNSKDEVSFLSHFAIVDKFDKERLKVIIKQKLENIVGKSDVEVIKKAMIYFDWQYQDDEREFGKL